PARVFIALALGGAGVATAVAGVMTFRRSHTTVNPLEPAATSSLVIRGVYRFSRNPMYLGFLLLLAGWAVCIANGVALLLLPAFVIYMTRYQIRPEERVLLSLFGHEFRR